MKKTSLTTIAILILSITLIMGCSKNINKPDLKNPSELSEDKAFIELATETYDYLIFISKQVSKNHLTSLDLQSQLSSLQSKNLPFNEQMISIDIIFKGDISERLNSHMKAYSLNWNTIKSKYSVINQEILEKECSEILSRKKIKEKKNLNEPQSLYAPNDCGWRYYLCSGAAAAGAILCHAGCDTTALATTAGFGIPACILLCGTLQSFAIVQCNDSYCD